MTPLRDDIFTLASFVNWWGELIGIGSLEDTLLGGEKGPIPPLEIGLYYQ